MIISLLFLPFVLLACSGVAPKPESSLLSIDGIVSRDGKSVSGAVVSLYDPATFTMPDEPAPLASVTSAEGGRFVLSAKPGNYLLIARTADGFAFSGRNPLNLVANQRGVSLPLVKTHAVTRSKVGEGDEGFSGTVYVGGAPLAGAVVGAYLKPDKGFKGPPYSLSQPTGPDGKYHIPLEPGSYYLVARIRASGKDIGPLGSGDNFGVHPVMPLRLKAGEGIAADFEVVSIPDQERMARFLTKFVEFSGRVVSEKGEPLAGFRPCLYDNPRMLNEPLEVGEPTGKDGRFTLKSTLSGDLYLGAREKLGGPPQSGERIGFLETKAKGPIGMAPGEKHNDLVIVVRPVP